VSRGLADTSFFVAREAGRPIDVRAIPNELAVSAITVGELRAGVLAATDLAIRDQRLSTLIEVLRLSPLPVDEAVADAWARLRVALREAGQRMDVNDSWIAATAIAHGIPVVTQDDGFVEVADLSVVRI
jgi:predicted nucleic acid-binding protein